MTKRILILLAVMTILSLVAACTAAPGAVTVVETVEVVEEVDKEVTAVPGQIKEGGTLTIAIGGDMDNFDPQAMTLIIFSDMFRFQVYGSLARINENLELVPDLAESWEIVDASTYIVKLREGVKFHNGREMTAEDVKFSFERVKDMAPTLARYGEGIDSMEILDDYTIQFNLATANAYFMDDTTWVSIIPQEAAETLASEPIGTGPFKFVEWRPNDRIVLERFEDYWDEGKPYVDEVVMRVMPDVQARIASLEAGEVDVVRDVSVVDALRFLNSEDIRVIKPDSSTAIQYFVMVGGQNEAIMNSFRVRQALAHALDKDAVNRTAWMGQGTPLVSPIAPSVIHFAEFEGYPYDPEKCKEILAEEGYPDLEVTVETLSGYSDGKQAAVIWQAGLAECGVTMNIVESEIAVWLDKYIGQEYEVSWNAMGLSANPNDWMDRGASRWIRAGTWVNEEAIELWEAGKSEIDPQKAAENFARLQEINVEELPVIMIGAAPSVSLVHSNVKNWHVSPSQLRLYREVWLDQ